MARRQFSVSCFCFWFSCCGLPMLRRAGNLTSFLKLYKMTEGIFTLHLAMCSGSVSIWSTWRLQHLPAQRLEAKSMVHLEFILKVFTRILPRCPSHVIESHDVQSHVCSHMMRLCQLRGVVCCFLQQQSPTEPWGTMCREKRQWLSCLLSPPLFLSLFLFSRQFSFKWRRPPSALTSTASNSSVVSSYKFIVSSKDAFY